MVLPWLRLLPRCGSLNLLCFSYMFVCIRGRVRPFWECYAELYQWFWMGSFLLFSPFFVAFYFRKRREKPLTPSIFFFVPLPSFPQFCFMYVQLLVLNRTVMLRHFDNSLSCQIIKQGEEKDFFFCKSWTMHMLQMSLAKWMFWGYSWTMYNPQFYSQVERRVKRKTDLAWHSTFVLKMSIFSDSSCEQIYTRVFLNGSYCWTMC